jgi:hypothetical protein
MAVHRLQGWHNLSDDDYHADPCPSPSLSASCAKTVIGKTLLHAWRDHPKSPFKTKDRSARKSDRGSAAHAWLFGGKTIAQIDADNYQTKAAKEARDNAREAGLIPILRDEYPYIEEMVEIANPRFEALLGESPLYEVAALWQAPSKGWRRSKMDSVSADRRRIVDYKTTEAAVDALSCERRIFDSGFHIQAAAYIEAVETLHPQLMGRVEFYFQWQEQKPPFALSPPILVSEAALELGRQQWERAGLMWDQAVRTNHFPGYTDQTHTACPPPWEITRWEERMSNDNTLNVEPVYERA